MDYPTEGGRHCRLCRWTVGSCECDIWPSGGIPLLDLPNWAGPFQCHLEEMSFLLWIVFVVDEVHG